MRTGGGTPTLEVPPLDAGHDLKLLARADYAHLSSTQAHAHAVRGLDLHLRRRDDGRRELFGIGLDADRVRACVRHALRASPDVVTVRVTVFSRHTADVADRSLVTWRGSQDDHSEGAVAAEVGVRVGLGYGSSGKLLDVYQPVGVPGPAPVVLFWHGRGPDERDVLAAVARAAAERGLVVLVPDWRPDAPDGGRAQLGESAEFVRRNAVGLGGDPERIVLAGWSLGGKAAVAVALNPEAFGGWRPSAVVGIAGAYGSAAPTTGTVPLDDLRRGGGARPPLPVWLVHGTADPVVDVERSRELHTALGERGWPTSLDEVATDHAGVIMTEFVPERQRCLPSTADHAVLAGSRTADVLARAAGITVGRSNRRP
ncbi:hypothetical protein [Streptomyces sp. AM6-12]|uniref:hypothetical protein n=1 Tax=Streptomyces sp. AM6-12 TaxID=3345149 RepID=UPI0037B63CF1